MNYDICFMKQILLFGAGKSATILIEYLLSESGNEKWKLVVADANLQLALSKINNHPAGEAVSFDINDENQRVAHIQQADLVISMLPPTLHFEVAKDCLRFSKHLLTASYVDDSMRSLEKDLQSKDILFLCEMGLDPGIDHMSAMKIIDDIREKGGKITSFQSHCGGLVAPESDDNPWHYKISWNPRNIIMAGKSGAHYLEKGKEIKLSYDELFRPGRNVSIPNLGILSWYPNRDSLSYAPLYGLNDTTSFLRTTLRHPDFMSGWKYIIDLKLTDETVFYETDNTSFARFFQQHLDRFQLQPLWTEINSQMALVGEQLNYLGFNDNSTLINRGKCSAADVLQLMVESKLNLQPGDRDMVVMLHEFVYELDNHSRQIKSSLVVKGKDSLHTAMAKTVGLPLGIATKLLLAGKIKTRGLHIPTIKEIYKPVLDELETCGVRFEEEEF